MNAVISGVDPNAEVVTNSKGGKQSQSPAALHLVDPEFLIHWVNTLPFQVKEEYAVALKSCFMYMKEGNDLKLYKAIELVEPDAVKRLFTVGERLQYGATKGNNGRGYPRNNWRLIPREDHLNHAMIHLIALMTGDTQDNHYGACLCRLHMAIATEESDGFKYTEPENKKDG